MKILNRKAKFNYQFLEKIEAGVVLTGEEVKALRAGKANISQAYAKIIGSEAFLINANISTEKEPTRSRKLLLHRKEIISLLTKIKAKNLTLVPTKLYTKGHLVKVELALAKSKKTKDKKASLKKKDLERDLERQLKDR